MNSLTASLTAVQSRRLALGLLALLMAALLTVVLVLYMQLWNYYSVPFAGLTDQLNRSTRIINSREAVQAALDELDKRSDSRFFLNSTISSLAASEIQEIIKNLVETNRGKLTSMQVVSPEDEEGYRRITVHVQFTSDMNALGKILYSIETMQPFLLVDNVHIQSRVNDRYQARAGVQPEVMVEFDLWGYSLIVVES